MSFAIRHTVGTVFVCFSLVFMPFSMACGQEQDVKLDPKLQDYKKVSECLGR